MPTPIHVLVFPAGEINAVELHSALSTAVTIKLFGGSSMDRHGPYIFKNYIGNIPTIDAPDFIETFNKILNEQHIDVVFPTHDSVALFFSLHASLIHAKIIVADKATAQICRDKAKTYKAFPGENFIPTLYDTPSSVRFPAFAKPRVASGSVGARVIKDPSHLEGVDFEREVVTEFLPGEELTVDCLTDFKGNLRVVAPRTRIRTLAGISVSGTALVPDQEIESIAQSINQRMKFLGLWYFQVKKAQHGTFKLLEISTRCAGGMCLTRATGINLPLLSVYTAMGFEVEAIRNDYNVTMDRTLINRYKISYSFNTVYLDFDDTLIVDGRVNRSVLMFIFQCKETGKAVRLITKHEGDIHEALRQLGLGESLFAEITHLQSTDEKIHHIDPDKAIFIDNAYKERQRVHDHFRIPVFDVDAVEVLLDWRS